MLPFLPFPSSLLVRPPPPPPPPARAFTPGQAEKRLKKWSMFGSSEEKYEDAADLFEKAANCYKREKMHKEAGNAFLKCAECFKKARFLFGESGVWPARTRCCLPSHRLLLLSCFRRLPSAPSSLRAH